MAFITKEKNSTVSSSLQSRDLNTYYYYDNDKLNATLHSNSNDEYDVTLQSSLSSWLRFCDISSIVNCHKRSPFNFTTYFLTPTCKSKAKTFRILQLNHSPQYLKNSNINRKWGMGSLLSMCAKTQLKENWLPLVRDIHTKVIHPQTIIAIGHKRNRCLICSNSTEQKGTRSSSNVSFF